MNERDKTLDEDLLKGRRKGVQVNKEDGSVTYTLGILKIEGKRSTLDKQQILLEMSKEFLFNHLIVEDDLSLREPVNLKVYLFIAWGLFGVYYFY